MTTSLQTDGDFSAAFTDSLTFQMPTITGSEFAFVLGTSEAASIANLVAGKADSTMVGTPTFNANSAILDQSNYFLTDLTEYSGGTSIALIKQASHPGLIISTYRHATSGVWLAFDTPSPYKPVGRALTAPANNGASLGFAFAVGDIEVVASILDTANAVQVIYHPRTGASFSRPIGTRSASADKFRIGSGPVPGPFDDVSAGAVEVYFAYASTAALSFGEVKTLYTPLKRWYGRRGIVI